MIEEMAPQVGFEPTTLRLTAECSAIELLRSVVDTPERSASEFPLSIISLLGCQVNTRLSALFRRFQIWVCFLLG